MTINIIFCVVPDYHKGNLNLTTFMSRQLEGLEEELSMRHSKASAKFLVNHHTGEYYYAVNKRIEGKSSSFLSGAAALVGPIGTGPTAHQFLEFMKQSVDVITQDIVAHKSTLDILTDFTTIIGVTIPLVSTIFTFLHRRKTLDKSEKIPSVTISITNTSVTVTDKNLEDAQHAAMNISRKLLKEHPNAKVSPQILIEGKLIEPLIQSTSSITSQVKQTSSRSQKRQSKKR